MEPTIGSFNETTHLQQNTPSSYIDKFRSLPWNKQAGLVNLGIAAVGFVPTAFVQGFCADLGGTGVCTASFVLRPLLQAFVTSGITLSLPVFDKMSNDESVQACWDKFCSLSNQEKAGVISTSLATSGFLLAACLEGQCSAPGTLLTCSAGFVVESLSGAFAASGLGLLLFGNKSNGWLTIEL